MPIISKWKPYALSWERYFATLFVYFILFSLIFPQIAVFLQLSEGITLADGLNVKYQMLIYLLSLIPCILFLLPILKAERKVDFKRLIISIIAVIILGILINYTFNVFIEWFHGDYVSSENQSSLDILAKQDKWLFLSMTLLFAPFLEELVFRGVFFHGLRSKCGFWIASISSSFMFGFIHVYSSILGGSTIDFIYLFLYAGLGFIFCFIYEYNKSILACIIVHMFYNAFASLSIIFS